MSRRKHGPGWVVYEDNYPCGGRRKLVSLLSPRLARDAVVAFIEQIYVDRFATIAGRLNHKKHPRSDPLCGTLLDRGGGHVHVGDRPYFHGVYAREITLGGNTLKLDYRILVSSVDPLKPVFEAREMILEIDEPAGRQR
jgi:hypothetical protein